MVSRWKHGHSISSYCASNELSPWGLRGKSALGLGDGVGAMGWQWVRPAPSSSLQPGGWSASLQWLVFLSEELYSCRCLLPGLALQVPELHGGEAGPLPKELGG